MCRDLPPALPLVFRAFRLSLGAAEDPSVVGFETVFLSEWHLDFSKDYDTFINKGERNGGILGRQRNVNKSAQRTATIKNNSARIRRWKVSFIDLDFEDANHRRSAVHSAKSAMFSKTMVILVI
jgi:hypothetical protein